MSPCKQSVLLCDLRHPDFRTSITWGLLQERITTTTYGPPTAPEIFTHSVFINAIQSAFAAAVGYIYLLFSSRSASAFPVVFPSRAIVAPLVLVAFTSSLASPFGYASLKHVGYITFILAKSCKLLPVLALHVLVLGRKYPLYKYAVVASVTAGVAMFTLYQPADGKKKTRGNDGNSSVYGLLLLSINLLLDGLTNATQDHINTSFRPYSGGQMMCANNALSTLLNTSYLLLLPLVSADRQLYDALGFISRHPKVGRDILSFAVCGAVGQIFIFYTLAQFSSLLLVTITVTRKMLTMLISVVWFRHRLSAGQWVGVAFVFGGVGAEAAVARWEKSRSEGELARQRGKKSS